MKDLKARIAEREQRAEEAKKQASANPADGDDGGDGEEGYNSWTVAELKEELDNRGIEYAASDKKADLVAKLEG